MESDSPDLPARDIPSVAESEWNAIVGATDVRIREIVAATVSGNKQQLARRFYSTMMADPQASQFLDHVQVEDRLGTSMQRWLDELFQVAPTVSVAASVAHQRFIGEVHARIQLPINLVARGARYLKRWICEHLAQEPGLERESLLAAAVYVGDMIDIAIELMSTAFVRGYERTARADEAYRLFSLGQNISIERERQRAALLEWSYQVLYAKHQRSEDNMRALCHSEFGLWLHHKAQLMFEGSPEVMQIDDAAERIDCRIMPRLMASQSAEDLAELTGDLQRELASIKFLLTALFDRYVEIENGRDVLTRLLNRRFMPAAINREIALAKRTDSGFALLLLDLDHFKRVNDSYGHDTGDLVLQQAATLVQNNVRVGDFIFRYGGEEILVMLVEIDQAAAQRIAEDIRRRFEDNLFLVSEGRTLKITASIGIAVFDGHPDYQYIVHKADVALYEAKNAGRNCCVIAPAAQPLAARA
jgi:diguanylate cyclase